MTSINEKFLATKFRKTIHDFTCPGGENRKRLGTNDGDSGALTGNRQQSWDQGKRKSAGE